MLKGRQAQLVLKGLRVKLGLRVLLARQAHKGQLELMELPDHRGQLVLQVQLELQVLQVLMEAMALRQLLLLVRFQLVQRVQAQQ